MEWSVRDVPLLGVAPGPLRAAVVLLVDEACASSCEAAIPLARALPGALVVGSTTAGAGRYGALLTFRLPGSGIGLAVPSEILGILAEGANPIAERFADGRTQVGHDAGPGDFADGFRTKLENAGFVPLTD